MSKLHEPKPMLVNGVRLQVLDVGPKSGPLVVLLHGFPDLSRGWSRQLGPLSDAGYRVVAPDQRGYNLSDKPRPTSAYHWSQLAGDVQALIHQLGYQQAFVVGHDLGGAVAWYLAEHMPKWVRGLVIMNAPHPWVLRKTILTDPRQLLKSHYMLWFQIPVLSRVIVKAWNFHLLEQALRDGTSTGAFSEEDLAAYRRAWSQPRATRSMLKWYRAVFWDSLTDSTCPVIPVKTLILWGVRDEALLQAMAPATRELVPQAELVKIPCASHWVQRDAAEHVNQHLLDFFGAPS